MPSHQFLIIAGPNGAGKSTAAAYLLAPETAFLNADEIAKELKAREAAPTVDIEAGRILLRRMDALEREGADIALETTLASRTLAPRITRLRASGYRFHLFFLWLPSADLAVERVAGRVRRGGHAIPEDVIRRRYVAGLRNFFALYQPLADTWRMYDNSRVGKPGLIASGGTRVRDTALWERIKESQNA